MMNRNKKKVRPSNTFVFESDTLEDIYESIITNTSNNTTDESIFSKLSKIDNDLKNFGMKDVKDLKVAITKAPESDESDSNQSDNYNKYYTNEDDIDDNYYDLNTDTIRFPSSDDSDYDYDDKDFTQHMQPNDRAALHMMGQLENIKGQNSKQVQTQIDELNSQSAKFRKEVESLGKTKDTLTREFDKYQKDVDDIRRQLDNSTERVKKANQDKESLKSDSERQKSINADQNRHIDSIRKDLNNLRNEKNTLETEIETLHKRLDEEKNKNLTAETKAILDKLRLAEDDNKKITGDSEILKKLDLEQLSTLNTTLIHSLQEVNKLLSHQIESRICVVCCEGPRNICFLPCAHSVCCFTCSTKLKECPMCREDITDYIKLLDD